MALKGVSQLQRFLTRSQCALRDLEFAVERPKLEISRRYISDQRGNSARCPHSVASNWARAASVCRRYFPQKSRFQMTDRFSSPPLTSYAGNSFVTFAFCSLKTFAPMLAEGS